MRIFSGRVPTRHFFLPSLTRLSRHQLLQIADGIGRVALHADLSSETVVQDNFNHSNQEEWRKRKREGKIKGNFGVGEGSVSVTPSLLLQCGKEMMDRIVGFFGSL